MMTERNQNLDTLNSEADLMKGVSSKLNQSINESLNTKEKNNIFKTMHVKINVVKCIKDELLNKIDETKEKANKNTGKVAVQDYPIICTNCSHGSPSLEGPKRPAESLSNVEIGVRLALDLRPKILDRKPTRDDADNIFHCALGKPDSYGFYVSSNCSEHRTELANFVREGRFKDTERQLLVYSAIERFVRGLEADKEYPEAINLNKKFEQFETDELQKSASLVQCLKQEIQEEGNKKLMKLLIKSNPSATTLNDQLIQISFIDQSKLQTVLDKCSDKLKEIMKQFVTRRDAYTFNWQENTSLTVIQEYSNYIQSSLRTLSLPELELLAFNQQIKIHFYDSANQTDYEEDPTMKFIETLNPNGDDEIHVLRKEDGSWQRLEINAERHFFYEQRDREAAFFSSQLLIAMKRDESDRDKNVSNSSFDELVKLPKHLLDDQALKYIKLINPGELGISKELSTALLSHYRSKEKHISTADLRYLVERVIDWRVRKENPVFYVYIVTNFCPLKWKYEFLLLEIEDRLQLVLPDKTIWRNHIYTLGDRMFQLLRKQLHESTQVTKERLKEILTLLAERLEFFEADLARLGKLSLEDWLYELKTKFWEKEINYKLPSVTQHDEKKEIIYSFLELENKKGESFCRDFMQKVSEDSGIKSWQDISARLLIDPYDINKKERSYSDIVAIMKEDNNNSSEMLNSLEKLKTTVNLAENFSGINSIEDVVLWKKQVTSSKELNVDEFLCVFDKVVEIKMRIRLRDTQKVAIVAFLTADRNILTQASTGEGKSLIVTAVAISQALKGKKVDIITSSALLAIRDSVKNSSEGGVRDIYEAFGLDVAHNCNPDEAARTRAYNAHVVYGELANYQRDYLLHTFYNKNIKGSRTYDFVIVDEVDCMLLDRGMFIFVD